MRSSRALAVAALAGLLSACGDNAAAPDSDPGPDAGDPCVPLSLGARDLHFDLFGSVLGLRFDVDTPLGGDVPESLLLELYDSTTDGLPALAAGTFAFGQTPDDNLATCQHCLWIPLDYDGSAPVDRVLIATEGTLTLTEVEDPLAPSFAGAAAGVVLREARLEETGATTLIDGGRCARLDALAFDTRPTPGRACLSAEDCGNPLLEVCSPATNTCTEPECGEFLGCPAERPTCVSQYGDRQHGACYAECDPTASTGCAAGQTCLQFGYDPSYGLCKQLGDGAVGSACTVEDNSSSCQAGSRCSSDRGVCTRTCRYFDDAPGCQAGAQCTMFGVCEPPAHGDPAGFGETCADGVELATACAADGDAFRGMCFAYSPVEAMICQEACLGEQGCEPEEFCAPRFGGGLGVCLPDPVCGDGALGEIDEVCDDGNTTSGDGCSADCQTVEYGPICAGAADLAPDSTVAGDTSSAWDGFQATCQLGIARAEVYRFVPPGRGRLRLTVGGSTQHVMSVRRDCADADSELACADNGRIVSQELVHQVTDDAEPLTVMVSAYTVLEQGPYSLHAEWTDEQCGDGVVAGGEVCDDGNTTSADGCRGDCLAIEYDAYCAAATPLTVGTTTGDLTGAPHRFDSTCANDEVPGGPDRLYRYTAPRAGTLRIHVPAADDLVSYAVLDGCGAPGTFTELGCSSSFLLPLEVPVTQGQTVTILVEAFNPWTSGSYDLSVELL